MTIAVVMDNIIFSKKFFYVFTFASFYLVLLNASTST